MKIYELDTLDDVTLSGDLQGRFEEIAHSFRFRKDDSFPDVEALCLHNGFAAQKMGLFDVALTWRQLREIATEMGKNKSNGVQ